jgi:hypothetical protein
MRYSGKKARMVIGEKDSRGQGIVNALIQLPAPLPASPSYRLYEPEAVGLTGRRVEHTTRRDDVNTGFFLPLFLTASKKRIDNLVAIGN